MESAFHGSMLIFPEFISEMRSIKKGGGVNGCGAKIKP